MFEFCNRMRIGIWSKLRVVGLCQLVDVTRKDDAIETCGEIGTAFLNTLV